MNPRIQIIAIIGSIGVMLLVFQLIRRRKLREEYALLWFGAGILLIGASLWRNGLEIAARLAGIAYAPSLLYLAAIAVGIVIAIHYSISLSRLADQNKRLAQEVAMLQHRLRRIERRGAADRHDEIAA